MNKHTSRTAAALAAAGLLAAVAIGSGVGASKGAVLATAEIQNASGGVIGFAKFTEDGSGRVHVNVKVDGLPVGLHGIHIHAAGFCTSETGQFSGASSHFDPLTTAIHGEHNPLASDGVAPDGYHGGDLPNLVVDADGRGVLNGETNGATLTVGLQSLLDNNGSAIVIHAAPDDLTTNPIGGSGARIACGVIIPK
jgi:superoxide dismutase, Cu-Zn family